MHCTVHNSDIDSIAPDCKLFKNDRARAILETVARRARVAIRMSASVIGLLRKCTSHAVSLQHDFQSVYFSVSTSVLETSQAAIFGGLFLVDLESL